MSDLEWKECGESQQLKAQGTGVVYWLIEHKDDMSLWVSPDSLNDGYTAFRGTEEGCIRNAELMEKDKKPKCHVEYDKYAEIQQKCLDSMAKQSFHAETANGAVKALMLSRARQIVREVFYEFDKVIEEKEELRERLANQKRRIE